jgi:hypothetical protein
MPWGILMEIDIIDEHHEAYICIERCFRSGIFRRPITLVHVDSHADLEGPSTSMSCYDRNYMRYVERHLDVGNFIAPLILRGLIKAVVWICAVNEPVRTRRIGSLDGRGKDIQSDVRDEYIKRFPDSRKWLFKKTTDIHNLCFDFLDDDECVLDIDCDYFSCNREPRPVFRPNASSGHKVPLRRTVSSDDPYRISLNGTLGKKVRPEESVVFNDSLDWINICIDHFAHYLRLRPGRAMISKSAKSGYTPARYADPIASRLARMLQDRPDSFTLPRRKRLRFAKSISFDSGLAYDSISRVFYGPFKGDQKTVLDDIARGYSLGRIFDHLMKKYRLREPDLNYQLMRFVFALKRLFVVD